MDNKEVSDFDAETVGSIVDHMNEDHADALSVYLQAFTDIKIEAINKLRMSDINADGITMTYQMSGEKSAVQIQFKDVIGKRLKDIAAARGALVAMVKTGRRKISPDSSP